MWLLINFTAVMIALAIAAIAVITILYAHAVASDRRHRAASCPCCTNAPFAIPDCLCAEDCGVEWCQARDPEPRPQCPWCDTRECLDRTLCNCGGPCGSWLCVDKEAQTP